VDVGGDRAVIAGDGQAQFLQGFDDGDGDRADRQIEPFAAHAFGGAQIMLFAVDRHAEGGVHDVELRVDAEGGGEEDAAVCAIAVEEIAVVEIAVAPGQCHRFRRLVQRVIVAFCQHVASSFSLHHGEGERLWKAKIWKNWKHVLRLSAAAAGFAISGGFLHHRVLKQVQGDESDSRLLLLRTSCKDSRQNGAICG